VAWNTRKVLAISGRQIEPNRLIAMPGIPSTHVGISAIALSTGGHRHHTPDNRDMAERTIMAVEPGCWWLISIDIYHQFLQDIGPARSSVLQPRFSHQTVRGAKKCGSIGKKIAVVGTMRPRAC
jgi:hypothetical protein